MHPSRKTLVIGFLATLLLASSAAAASAWRARADSANSQAYTYTMQADTDSYGGDSIVISPPPAGSTPGIDIDALVQATNEKYDPDPAPGTKVAVTFASYSDLQVDAKGSRLHEDVPVLIVTYSDFCSADGPCSYTYVSVVYDATTGERLNTFSD
jgi:hypothetical protein